MQHAEKVRFDFGMTPLVFSNSSNTLCVAAIPFAIATYETLFQLYFTRAPTPFEKGVAVTNAWTAAKGVAAQGWVILYSNLTPKKKVSQSWYILGFQRFQLSRGSDFRK